MIKDEV